MENPDIQSTLCTRHRTNKTKWNEMNNKNATMSEQLQKPIEKINPTNSYTLSPEKLDTFNNIFTESKI